MPVPRNVAVINMRQGCTRCKSGDGGNGQGDIELKWFVRFARVHAWRLHYACHGRRERPLRQFPRSSLVRRVFWRWSNPKSAAFQGRRTASGRFRTSFTPIRSINRYSIGDRTKGLVFGPDKSLTVYLSHESPGKDKEANWLPTPAGKYSLVARVYGPEKTCNRWNMETAGTGAN